MSTGAFSAETKRKVFRRAEGMCERCKRHGITDYHHRRPRGMGGTKDPVAASAANCLALCRTCHMWIESNRAMAREQGYLVRQGVDPATVPIGDSYFTHTGFRMDKGVAW